MIEPLVVVAAVVVYLLIGFQFSRRGDDGHTLSIILGWPGVVFLTVVIFAVVLLPVITDDL